MSSGVLTVPSGPRIGKPIVGPGRGCEQMMAVTSGTEKEISSEQGGNANLADREWGVATDIDE